MIKKENKFLVITLKHLEHLDHKDRVELGKILERLKYNFPEIKNKKYIVCNQDEPYAERVWQIILEGEKQKLTDSAFKNLKEIEKEWSEPKKSRT